MSEKKKKRNCSRVSCFETYYKKCFSLVKLFSIIFSCKINSISKIIYNSPTLSSMLASISAHISSWFSVHSYSKITSNSHKHIYNTPILLCFYADLTKLQNPASNHFSPISGNISFFFFFQKIMKTNLSARVCVECW